MRSTQPTLAGERDHIGILFSSVNNAQRSSALACIVALISTVAVLITLGFPAATGFFSASVGLVGGAGEYDEEAAALFGVDAPEAASEAASDAAGACAARRAGRKALNFSSKTRGRALRT